MNFPEQELFSLEDVAARWQKSVPYVQSIVKRKLLPVSRGFLQCTSGGKHRRFTIIARVTRQDLEQFENSHGLKPQQWGAKKEAAAHYGVSTKTIENWENREKIEFRIKPSGRKEYLLKQFAKSLR